MSRIIVLGSGTALPDRDRDNTSLVWDAPDGAVLIDCGGRAYQQLLRAGVDPARLRTVLLTHAHPDHIYGLPALLFHLWLARYPGTLDIHANTPTLETARRLVDALNLERDEHMCRVAWHTFPDQDEYVVEECDTYRMWVTPVQHSIPCHAVRIEDRTSGQTLVYSADTQPYAGLEQFARGAHTLIHEATTANPDEGHGHTTPRQAGEIAARAGVERLLLIHFSAQYTMPETDAIAEVRAGGFQQTVAVAEDLAEYRLG